MSFGVGKALTGAWAVCNLVWGDALAGNVEYEVAGWSDVYDMLMAQAEKICSCYRADVVVGVSRGGLVSARILADLLEAPEFAVIGVEFYADIAESKMEPTLLQPVTMAVTGKRVLLVDDIADSGRSLQLAIRHLQAQGAEEIKTATLYYKPKSAIKPDFYEKETSSWVVFPWETKETLHSILRRQSCKEQVNGEIAKIVKAGLPKQLADKLLKDMQ